MSNLKISPTAVHQALKVKISNILQVYSDEHKLSQIEVLCVASQMVGMIIAMQDQRVYNPDEVMKIVADNIKAGNDIVVEQLLNSKGQA